MTALPTFCRNRGEVPEIAAAEAVARLARYAERALEDLSLAQYRVLSAVAVGDERASRVAAKFALGKPTVSETIDALCRKGLLSKSVVGDDQRVRALALTRRGWVVLARADAALVGALRELAVFGIDTERLVDTLVSVGMALEAETRARRPASRETRHAHSATDPAHSA